MRDEGRAKEGRLRRLAEELDEEGLVLGGPAELVDLTLTEIDQALRPAVHERRVPSSGSILAPTAPPTDWQEPTGLDVACRSVPGLDLAGARRFADGLSSWLVLRPGGERELAVFDRPAGSERDLVVLASATGGTLVQRHPSGVVRVVGDFGVLRWDGLRWHHEPPFAGWIDAVRACGQHGDGDVLGRLLGFAVHDLGARGVGSILIYRPNGGDLPASELRLPVPPPLEIRRPEDLAPLRHALAQVDGAAVFDRAGTLRHLGVRLVPSETLPLDIDTRHGMRHIAGIRYSRDDPSATVVVVSEDGPVTVLRNGVEIGRSDPGC